jgi:hypothetical protein
VKVEAKEALHGIVNYAETQWDVKVQVVQLDKGREYGFT